tara:strand:- start:3980 stop:4213 length:234 start_codon:yes stop_codon:yes gene_type:complete
MMKMTQTFLKGAREAISLFKNPPAQSNEEIKPVYSGQAQQGDVPSDAEIQAYSAILMATMVTVPVLGFVAAVFAMIA